MLCTKCGRVNDAAAQACHACGAPFGAASASIIRKPDAERKVAQPAAKGGGSGMTLIVGIVLGCFMLVGVLAAIAIPAYHDYQLRARVSIGFLEARTASAIVSTYYQDADAYPASLAELGFRPRSGTQPTEYRIDQRSGVITVEFSQRFGGAKSIMLTPTVDQDRQFIWKCHSDNLPDKQVPEPCRKK